MARAKAEVIMLIQVPLASTDTKINAMHFIPLSSRSTVTSCYLAHLYNPLEKKRKKEKKKRKFVNTNMSVKQEDKRQRLI